MEKPRFTPPDRMTVNLQQYGTSWWWSVQWEYRSFGEGPGRLEGYAPTAAAWRAEILEEVRAIRRERAEILRRLDARPLDRDGETS